MSRGPCTFRERDVKAALKVVRESHLEIARVEIDKDGKIIIITGKPAENCDAPEMKENRGANEWDSI